MRIRIGNSNGVRYIYKGFGKKGRLGMFIIPVVLSVVALVLEIVGLIMFQGEADKGMPIILLAAAGVLGSAGISTVSAVGFAANRCASDRAIKNYIDEKYGDGMMSAEDVDREAKEAELKALDKKISLGSTLTTVFGILAYVITAVAIIML